MCRMYSSQMKEKYNVFFVCMLLSQCTQGFVHVSHTISLPFLDETKAYMYVKQKAKKWYVFYIKKFSFS